MMKRPANTVKPYPSESIFSKPDREQDLCLRILTLVRDELYLDFRYFDRAFAALYAQKNESLVTTATDGICFYYPPAQLLRVFPENPVFLNRAFLHSVLHCIFRHLWLRNGRDIPFWNLACDIVVEYMIDSFDKPSVRRTMSGIRLRLYKEMKEKNRPVTASLVYLDLLQMRTDTAYLNSLAREFHVDDHRFWPGDSKASPSAAQASSTWERLGRRTEQELSLTGEDPSETGKRLITEIQASRHRRSYGDFLRRFTVLREELHIDPDEFDPGYYSYGLRLYGNLPLIEPLESREVRKIRELIMVIDTSYSTSGPLVKAFLERTFEILMEKDHYFKQCRIHVLQCDDQVRDVILIENEADIRRLLHSFELIGGGGTDFRPAFSYVDEKILTGEIKNPGGLIYFTDGKGIFPKKKTPYPTAFLFFGQKAPDTLPHWAMKLELSEEDFLL